MRADRALLTGGPGPFGGALTVVPGPCDRDGTRGDQQAEDGGTRRDLPGFLIEHG